MSYSNRGYQSGGSANLDEKLKKQIENARKRLQHEGVNVEKEGDGRGFFEKTLGLKKGNILQNSLEFLDKGRNGVMNVVDGIQTNSGKNVLQEFGEGFTGKEEVLGSKVLENAGINNKYAKGIGGFALDVLADPLTYVGGAGIAKAGVAAASAGKKAGAGIAKVLPESAQNGLKTAGGGLKQIKEGFGEIAGGSKYGLDSGMRKIVDDATATRRYYENEIIENNALIGKNAPGPIDEAGREAGRIMERPMIENRQNPTSQRNVDKLLEAIENKNVAKLPDGTVTQNAKDVTLAKNGVREELKSAQKNIKTFDKTNKANKQSIQKAITSTNLEMSKLYTKTKSEISKQYRIVKEGEVPARNSKKTPITQPEFTRKVEEAVFEKPEFQSLVQKRDRLNGHIQNSASKYGNLTNQTNANIGALKQSLDKLNEFNPLQQGQKNLDEMRLPAGPNKPLNEKYRETAEQLTKGNQAIRQLAQEKNIQVRDMEGYMSRVLSQETKTWMKEQASKGGAQFKKATGRNGDVLYRGKKFEDMSVEEINTMMGKEFFEPNAFFATPQGQMRLMNYIVAEDAKRNLLGQYGRKFTDKADIGPDEVVINIDNYRFLEGALEGTGKREQFIIPKNAKKILDGYGKIINGEELPIAVKYFDKVQNLWKKLALFSTGYHGRNYIGSDINMRLSGMKWGEIYQYRKKALDVMTKQKDLREKVIKGGRESLGPEELKLWDEYQDFRRQGLVESSMYQQEFKFDDPTKVMRNRIEFERASTLGKAKSMVKTPFQTSQQIGTKVDENARFAMYMAKRDKFLKEGVKPEAASVQAREKVFEALFDYEDLAPFEKEVSKRFIPFYTWIRKNSEYQLKSFARQTFKTDSHKWLEFSPNQYTNVDKGIREAMAASEIDRDSLNEWQKEDMHIPIPFLSDGKGSGYMANPGMTQADLGKLGSPLNLLIEGLSPAFKLPFEFHTNTNSFNGQPIQKFDGEHKKFLQLPSALPDFNAGPVSAKDGAINFDSKLSHFLSQMGAVRNLGTRSQQFGDKEMAEFFSGGMLRKHDAEKRQTSQNYEELRTLQELMNLFEQQNGRRPKGINEIGR